MFDDYIKGYEDRLRGFSYEPNNSEAYRKGYSDCNDGYTEKYSHHKTQKQTRLNWVEY